MARCNERIYRIWVAMRKRCRNPNDSCYARYGGRGISVCEEWEDYEKFRVWALTHGYSDELTIDRIDNDGNYCPENCRWATYREQANNKSGNHCITFNGETRTCMEWDRYLGFPEGTTKQRIRIGWSIERTLTEPVGEHSDWRRYTYKGETHTLHEWADILGMNFSSLWKRVEVKKLPLDVAFEKPRRENDLYLSYGGRTQTLSAWASELDLTPNALWKRIKRDNWSLERALTTPRAERFRKKDCEHAKAC